MKNTFIGKAFVLGDDIDTDQIIPAGHLIYSLEKPEERKLYGRYALSGVPLKNAGLPEGGVPFVEEDCFSSGFTIIVAGKNFGCGSSREHAPAALEIAGIKAVVATSYARIFFRNAVDGGFLFPAESEERLVEKIRTGDTVELNCSEGWIKNNRTGELFQLQPLGAAQAIVEAGGIFAYARQEGIIGGTRS